MTALFIRRPVMTVWSCWEFCSSRGGVPQAPSERPATVDFPTISVNANLSAPARRRWRPHRHATREAVSTIAGIDNMTSTSTLGRTSITIQFSLDRNIDAAAADVQAAMSRVLRSLPLGILPPSYQKVNPADAPILFFALTSKTLALSELDEYGNSFLAQRISMVPGIRPGAGVRRSEVRGSDSAQSSVSRQPRDRNRRSRVRDFRAERQHADRNALGPESRVHDRRQWSAPECEKNSEASWCPIATRTGAAGRLGDVTMT